MARGVAGRFVIGEAVLVFVMRDDVERFETTAALVFQVDIFHVAIDTQFDSDDEFVTDIERTFHCFEHWAFVSGFLHVKSFVQFERSALVWGHFGHVLHVLPMDAAPGHALIDFANGHFAELRLHLGAGEFLFVEARACLNFLRLDLLAADGNGDERVRSQIVRATKQESIDRVGGRFGRFPILGLLLFEQPDFAVLDGG